MQWAFLRAMRSETDSLVQSVDRLQPLLPHMDTLEIMLREKVRKEWGQHLAAAVYHGNIWVLFCLAKIRLTVNLEMASLPTDFTADTDSSILAQVMTKLDEPITLGSTSTFGMHARNWLNIIKLIVYLQLLTSCHSLIYWLFPAFLLLIH